MSERKSRDGRLKAITEIVLNSQVETQEDLSCRLASAGYRATQSTVSRDIKTLGLIKVMSGDKQIYALPQEKNVGHKLSRILVASVVDVAEVGRACFVKTVRGCAAAVKESLAKESGLVAAISDFDTVCMVFENESFAREFAAKMRDLL